MMMQTLSITLLFTLICCNDFRATLANEFAYNGDMGPDHWSEHYSMCSGKHQSPINIDLVHVISRTFPLLKFEHFFSSPNDTEMLNNGHTVVVRFDYPGDRPTVSGGPLEGQFVFEQLHFHWGDNDTFGSEDRINNVSFPAELHVVLRNANYSSFAEAAAQSNGVAVFAYFFQIKDDDNRDYNEFTELLGNIIKPGMVTTFKKAPNLFELTHVIIDSYYTYTGSLTTPPCSENVTWIDFTEPISISARQIDRFRHLYTYDDTPLTHNFRPLQPLNDRTIFAAIPQTWDEAEDDDVDQFSAIPFVDILFGGAVKATSFGFINHIFITLLLYLLTTTLTKRSSLA